MRKLIIITLILGTALHSSYAQINIWEGIRHHKRVVLTPYLASGDNNIAIVVCPGGSYFWHDTNTEGHDVAKWLKTMGISAFVLNYRTAYVPAFLFRYRWILRGNRYPDPQDDLRQALKIIRSRYHEFGINPNRVGAMGFSAGGHLVMSALELFDKDDQPDFAVPVYPVVTMNGPYVHKRSRRGLLGESKKHNKRLKDLLSLEKHVTKDCRPVFLVNCVDDPIVDYHNSVLLDSALTAQNVKHVYLQYHTGGHGFGMSDTKGSAESRQWKYDFIEWINKLFP